MKLFFPFFTLVGLIFSAEPSQARASIHIGAHFGVPAPVVSYPAPCPVHYPAGYYAPPAPAPYYYPAPAPYYPAPYYNTPVVMLPPPPPVMVMSPFAPPMLSVGLSSSSRHGHYHGHRHHHGHKHHGRPHRRHR